MPLHAWQDSSRRKLIACVPLVCGRRPGSKPTWREKTMSSSPYTPEANSTCDCNYTHALTPN